MTPQTPCHGGPCVWKRGEGGQQHTSGGEKQAARGRNPTHLCGPSSSKGPDKCAPRVCVLSVSVTHTHTYLVPVHAHVHTPTNHFSSDIQDAIDLCIIYHTNLKDVRFCCKGHLNVFELY